MLRWVWRSRSVLANNRRAFSNSIGSDSLISNNQVDLDYSHDQWVKHPEIVVKQMVKAAKMEAKDKELWSSFVDKLSVIGNNLQPADVVRAWYAFGEVQYRDWKMFRTLSPITLQCIDELTPHGIALIINAYKRLESPRTSQLDFLISQCVKRMDEMSATDLALSLNAAAHFYVNHNLFWKGATRHLPSVVGDMTNVDLTISIAAFARIEERKTKVIALMGRRITAVAQSLNPQEISVVYNAFAKLDFNQHNLRVSMQKRIHHILDEMIRNDNSRKATSIALGTETSKSARVSRRLRTIQSSDDFSQSNSSLEVNTMQKHHDQLVFEYEDVMKTEGRVKSSDNVVSAVDKAENNNRPDFLKEFDAFGLVQTAFAALCLTGCSESLALKLLRTLTNRSNQVRSNVTNIRKLKLLETTVRVEYPNLFSKLDPDVCQFLEEVKKDPRKVFEKGSKWAYEVAWVLQEMGIKCERRVVAGPHHLDVYLPEKRIVLKCLGPFAYYRSSTERTALSKLTQRQLEAQGLHVVPIPYFEWVELTTGEMKQRFLWSLGRRAAEDIRSMESADASTLLRRETAPRIEPNIVEGFSNDWLLDSQPVVKKNANFHPLQQVPSENNFSDDEDDDFIIVNRHNEDAFAKGLDKQGGFVKDSTRGFAQGEDLSRNAMVYPRAPSWVRTFAPKEDVTPSSLLVSRNNPMGLVSEAAAHTTSSVDGRTEDLLKSIVEPKSEKFMRVPTLSPQQMFRGKLVQSPFLASKMAETAAANRKIVSPVEHARRRRQWKVNSVSKASVSDIKEGEEEEEDLLFDDRQSEQSSKRRTNRKEK